MWKMKKIQGKVKQKEIDVWHIFPETHIGLFATFTDQKVAEEYLEWVNKNDQS